MTPKEKAEDLVNKFRLSAIFTDSYVKAIAKTAVDEMIIQNGELYLNGLDGIYYREKNSYLFEVKQEIEAL